MVKLDSQAMDVRPTEITSLLAPLARDPNRFVCKRVPNTKRAYFAVRNSVASADDPRDWRFSSPKETFVFRYTESWIRSEADTYDLYHFSLGLHRTPRPQEDEEWLSLDCEPTWSPAADHGIYKQGPHMHIKRAGEPLSHIHFPLITASLLPRAFESSDDLFIAVSDIVTMLKKQVLPSI